MFKTLCSTPLLRSPCKWINYEQHTETENSHISGRPGHQAAAVAREVSTVDTTAQQALPGHSIHNITEYGWFLACRMNPLSIYPENFTVVESEEGQLLAFAQLQPVAAAAGSTPTYEFRSLVVDPKSR
jgi:hypothetical protein